MSKKRVTIKDIARQLGIAIGLCRGLWEAGYVSPRGGAGRSGGGTISIVVFALAE